MTYQLLLDKSMLFIWLLDLIISFSDHHINLNAIFNYSHSIVAVGFGDKS